ncbi:hypothetical protein O0L34_g3224 [Tuta absoluta]|nr:hypothetical protein O0L34_g3224 [Tuta absoluta]
MRLLVHASGKVRIWDTVNKEHILKNEFQPIGGPIKDIAWSADSQRMVVVGEGRERFGHVFMSETGTSVGEISGQSKPINSVDFRPSRPFRIVTASEDNTIAVFEGPPFKFKCTKQEHTRFAQAVRYSPDGSLFASAGFDGKIFLYDGATSELKGEIGSPAHKGGVYGISWSPDGKQLLSCSGDKTCAIWDVETQQRTTLFNMGNAVENQQVSCLWQGKYLLSVSLSGVINYLDIDNPDKPLQVLMGHNKPITCLAPAADRRQVYTASHDGTVTQWDVTNGEGRHILGQGHGNQVNGMSASQHGALLTCGIDDTLRTAKPQAEDDVPTYLPEGLPLGSQPRAMDHIVDTDTTIVATVKELAVVLGGSKQSSVPLDFEPTCVTIDPKSRHVAVGGTDNKVHIYTLDIRTLTPSVELQHLGPVTHARFSPDGKYLAACDANRKVILYSTDDYKLAHNREWGFHTARVNCVAWSPDSARLASGSLDTTVIVWSVATPNKHVIIKNAHPQNQITGLAWLDDETLLSVGQDANTRVWTVPKV